MNSRLTFHIAVMLIAAIGVATAWVRHTQTQIPLLPGAQQQVWLVESRVDFVADGGPVTVSLSIPKAPPGFRLLTEQTASPGYGFAVVEDRGERRGEWTIRSARGPQTLYYKAQLVPDPAPPPPAAAPEPPAAVMWEEPQATAARQLLERAAATSSTPQSLTRELIKLLTAVEPDQNTALLLSAHPPVLALDKLLRQAGVPTRMAMGLTLEDGRRNQRLVPMIEIFADGHWHLFDPRNGRQGVPDDLLLWHQGGRSLVDVTGGSRTQVRFSMLSQTVPLLELARTEAAEGALTLFDIHHLPVEEQNLFRILLLLPLASLVVVFARIVIGLPTAGTFMPVLIALAFLQTSLSLGLVSFLTIVSLGLLLRRYLSYLNLLLIARIAAIVVIVVFLIGVLSVLGYRLGFNTGMTVTFFPIIIIAWTIERMSILWEEEGPREVLVQGGGSLLVAIAAYLLMQWPVVAHLSFNFPELNLVVLALILLIGNYTGYRLLELYRFHTIMLEDR